MQHFGAFNYFAASDTGLHPQYGHATSTGMVVIGGAKLAVNLLRVTCYTVARDNQAVPRFVYGIKAARIQLKFTTPSFPVNTKRITS